MASFFPTRNSGLFGILAPALPGNPSWPPAHSGSHPHRAPQAGLPSRPVDTALHADPWMYWGGGRGGVPARTLGGAPGPCEKPHVTRLRPKLKGHRSPLPYVSRPGTVWMPGSLWDRPRPLPSLPCLPAQALSIGSGAGSHRPHPQLEMKPELWMLGALCQPDSWHCHPETWASAPGVRPHSQAERG